MSIFGVTADLQFGLYNNMSVACPETGLTTRLRDQIKCFEWIVEESVAAMAKGLIIVGDVFESRTEIDVGVLHTVCDAFKKASEKLLLYVVVGNHDSYLRRPELHSTGTLAGAATIFSEPTVLFNKPQFIEGYAFVPWSEDYEDIKKGVAMAVEEKAKYLFAHVMLSGAVPANKGMPLAYLQPEKFEQVLLGDIHEPMEMDDNVQYCGSPMQLDYREAGGKRGFWILDTYKGSIGFRENEISPRFHIINDVTTEGIREGDFVRVKTDDAAIATEAVAAAQKKTGWVESTLVELDDTPPRLDVRAKDTQEDVLGRYVKHVLGEENEEVVAVGMEILEEAR